VAEDPLPGTNLNLLGQGQCEMDLDSCVLTYLTEDHEGYDFTARIIQLLDCVIACLSL